MKSRMAPASLVKSLSAIVNIEDARLFDSMVCFSGLVCFWRKENGGRVTRLISWDTTYTTFNTVSRESRGRSMLGICDHSHSSFWVRRAYRTIVV